MCSILFRHKFDRSSEEFKYLFQRTKPMNQKNDEKTTINSICVLKTHLGQQKNWNLCFIIPFR